MNPSKTILSLDRETLRRLVTLEHKQDLEIERIEHSLAVADHEDAACRMLARLKLGLDVPEGVAASVLYCCHTAEVFCAIGQAVGPGIVAPLLSLIEQSGFAEGAAGSDRLLWTTLLLDRFRLLDDRARRILLPHLRSASRRPWLNPWTIGLLGFVVERVQDASLSAVFEEHRGDMGPVAAFMGEMMTDRLDATLDEAIACLPLRALEHPLRGIPLRAAQKPGRNDLCDCGSGRKFKKCCANGPRTLHASGDATIAQLHELEPTLTYAQVAGLSGKHLAQLDLARLKEDALVAAMRSWATDLKFDRAIAAVAAMKQRSLQSVNGHIEDLIRDAFSAGKHETASQLFALLDQPDAGLQLKLAVATKSASLSDLEGAALAALRGPPENGAEIDLACDLLDVSPALGILLARGAMWAERMFDAEHLLREIEAARDRLLLAPADRARATFEAIGGQRHQRIETATRDDEHDELTRTASELQQKLAEASGKIHELRRQKEANERALSQAQSELERARRESAPTRSQHDVPLLERKVAELKALLTERNQERAELRQQLSEAAAASVKHQEGKPARDRHEDDSEEGGAALVPHGRPVLLPCFRDDFGETLRSVPRPVAAEAMRTVGALAASDLAAWRGVKQAKEMARAVFMARIGIHHRLLFRAEQQTLEVIELVHRGELELALKRLRG